jgi:hypothetical protein
MIDSVLADIEEKMLNKEADRVNNIPYDLPKLSNIFPMFIKGMYSCITSNPSVGKTTLLNALVFSAIKNAIINKIPLKVMWFALEDGRDKVVFSLISWLLYEKYKIRIGYLELNSYTSVPLKKEILNKIKDLSSEIELYLSYLIIDEDNSNPTGIYNTIKKHAEEHKHVKKVEKVIGTERRLVFEKTEYEGYVIIVLDHISMLSLEAGCPTLRDSMLRWSKYVKDYITLKFNYCVLNVHQQQAAAENVDHFKAGRIIPTQDKLADAPVLGRDYRMILGVYYPAKYNVTEELGYDITALNENYRSLYIIKNSFGEANKALGVWFDGACSNVKELPKASEFHEMKKIYDYKKSLVK